jgi:hypothetical protein
VHRWLGVGLCLLFTGWFASGMVLVFAGFPRLDEERRLQALPELVLDAPTSRAVASPATARRAGGLLGVEGRVRLGMLGQRPVYRFVDARAVRAGLVDAVSFARLPAALDPGAPDGIAALAAPHRSGPPLGRGASSAVMTTATPIERADQWTLSRPAKAVFPLLRLDAGDAAASEIYLSLRTAEVVQVTTRRTQALAWLGAIPHWIYPSALRRYAVTWRRLVLVLASAGLLLCLSGLLLGVWSWRPRGRRHRQGRSDAAQDDTERARGASPYASRWLRWHHNLGLLFGAFASTWVATGALSLDPFPWSTGDSPSALEEEAFAGGPLRLDRFTLSPAEALRACRREIHPREIELVQVGGHPFYLCRESPRNSRLVAADAQMAVSAPRLDDATALAGARALWPDGSTILAEPIAGDTFVGDSSAAADASDLAVPAPRDWLRTTGAGACATWYYVDLRGASLAARYDRTARVGSQLFRALHTLDLPFLPARSMRWYLVIVGLCSVGLVFSLTAVVLAFNRIARSRSRRVASTRSAFSTR